jgi:hypothetical protein
MKNITLIIILLATMNAFANNNWDRYINYWINDNNDSWVYSNINYKNCTKNDLFKYGFFTIDKKNIVFYKDFKKKFKYTSKVLELFYMNKLQEFCPYTHYAFLGFITKYTIYHNNGYLLMKSMYGHPVYDGEHAETLDDYTTIPLILFFKNIDKYLSEYDIDLLSDYFAFVLTRSISYDDVFYESGELLGQILVPKKSHPFDEIIMPYKFIKKILEKQSSRLATAIDVKYMKIIIRRNDHIIFKNNKLEALEYKDEKWLRKYKNKEINVIKLNKERKKIFKLKKPYYSELENKMDLLFEPLDNLSKQNQVIYLKNILEKYNLIKNTK